MATCAPLAMVAAKSASFPKATHRCHSVRDSHAPESFFQDVLVANEKIAIFVVSLTFFSASLPMKPIRVILFRYIRFSVSALLSRAPGREWARLPRPEAAFLGGTGTGEPEPERCCRQSRSFAGAGRRKSPEAVPGQRAGQETCLKWVGVMVVAAAEKRALQKSSPRRLHRPEHSTAWFRSVRHGVTPETLIVVGLLDEGPITSYPPANRFDRARTSEEIDADRSSENMGKSTGVSGRFALTGECLGCSAASCRGRFERRDTGSFRRHPPKPCCVDVSGR